MKSKLLPLAVCIAIVSFLMLSFSMPSSAAQDALTKSEYNALLANDAFKNSEQKLSKAYKEYLSTAKSEDEIKDIKQGQRYWIAMREKSAAEKFKKGSPAYIQSLIDSAAHRMYTFQWNMNGKSGRVKSANEFYTLDYKNIAYDGIIKSEHKLHVGDSGAVAQGTSSKTSDVQIDTIVRDLKKLFAHDEIRWLSYTKDFIEFLERVQAMSQSPVCRDIGDKYNNQELINKFKTYINMCNVYIQLKRDADYLVIKNVDDPTLDDMRKFQRESRRINAELRNIEEKLGIMKSNLTSMLSDNDFMLCSERVRELEIKKQKEKVAQNQKIVEEQNALFKAQQEARLAELNARAALAEQLKDTAVNRIKESRYKLFSDASYPTIGKAFDAYFGAPKKWQGNTYGPGGREIAVAFEGIAMLNGRKAKFVIWFTHIDPALVRDNKPLHYGMVGYVNGKQVYDGDTIGDLFAAIYLNN